MARISKDHLDHFYNHNIDVSTRTLFLGHGESRDHDLDEHLAADILRGIHILEHANPDAPINIIINCTGGDVDHGLAIYDRICNSPCEVIGTVYGCCWSMAAWVLQACDTRRMSINSSMMIHHGEGSKDSFTKHQDEVCVDILLDRIHQKNPGFPRVKLNRMLNTDTYLDCTEALGLGLIDEVVGANK